THVDVRFASGADERYDLVIGADGVHSRVRTLAFGAEPKYMVHMGSAMAIATIPNSLSLVREQLSYNDVKRIATVKSSRGNRELVACLFYETELEAFDPDDEARQRRQVKDAFAAAGWQLPTIARAVAEADDFHAALTCQIRMERYHAGRAVLVGDAA